MTDLPLPLIGPAVAALVLVYMIVSPIRYRYGTPSEFAAGIAKSLRDDSSSWDYSSDETWLISEKADLAMSLQGGNWGRLNTNNRPNRGSTNIVEGFKSADHRAVVMGFRAWKENTAIDRKRIADGRKRDALRALAA